MRELNNRLFPAHVKILAHILQPIWDKKLIHQSYACRPGKGQHKCSDKISECVKKYKYCALTDISKFYPSIPHKKLYEIVERKIKDILILAVKYKKVMTPKDQRTLLRYLKEFKKSN